MVRRRTQEQTSIELPLAGLMVNGRATSLNELIEWMTPIVRARAIRILMRWSKLWRDDMILHDVEEITQDLLTFLFADRARVLLSWDANRGLSLANYIGLVVERAATRILQTRSRHLFLTTSDSVCVVEEDVADCGPGPEAVFSAREYVEKLVDRIRRELSGRGEELFEMLLLEQRPVDEVCSLTGLSRDATYTWRSRIANLAKRIANEVELE